MHGCQAFGQRVIDNVERVVIGKRRYVELTVVALLCGGHVLIEDVPGVGKTSLARALAVSLGGVFKRVQCTPDLLPSDITGVSIFDQQRGSFEFRPGPIVGNFVLADEINRATPKAQSALLECMEEGQVTVDGVSHPLPTPFIVLATQNPIDYEGTFPLPEAQLDRFLLQIALGYPAREDEVALLDQVVGSVALPALQPVATAAELAAAQAVVNALYAEPALKSYVVEISAATRGHPDVYLGASPRASLALYQAARALAAVRGRDFLLPDDVKEVAEPVLAHRLIMTPAARVRGVRGRDVVAAVLQRVPVPGAGLVTRR